jgi:ParB family transcriptional regulator, chromosome partitioning protein
MTRNALGRGLNALIREPEPPTEPLRKELPIGRQQESQGESIQMIDLGRIQPSPYQPRSRFENQALDDLTASIRASGVIQPLLLRQHGDRYQLIAGERRWRAAQRAGLSQIPAVIRNVSEEKALEIAIVENLQREDLNPIEQANAFDRLIRQFNFTQEAVAERTGKDRATIANAVRLLKLERPIQEMVEGGEISSGHARALLGIENPGIRMKLARRCSNGGLTVRQLERYSTKKRGSTPPPSEEILDPNTRAAIEELQRVLGTRILLRKKTKKRPGMISIEYYDDKQLMDLYERLIHI